MLHFKIQITLQILPIIVHEDNLSFGQVFPGEELQGKFTVHYVQEYQEQGVHYRIIQKLKPLPDGSGYYKDLCPFLSKVSLESEGDLESEAYVGINDPSDEWTVYFKVPAIMGNVSQDNSGGVVTTSGEYGCDISIDIIEP